jgi:hypothetical protein
MAEVEEEPIEPARNLVTDLLVAVITSKMERWIPPKNPHSIGFSGRQRSLRY